MLSGTARVLKCAPFHFVAEQLSHLVLSIILGFHVLTEFNTMLPLSGKCKYTCWKMLLSMPILLEKLGMITLMMLGCLYVRYMGLDKRMS